jgi:hypothetical protein
MGSGSMRLLALSCVAVLLAGCQDPLEPERHSALVQSQGGPRTPSDPYSSASSATAITVFWTDNSSNETGWEVHRSITGRDGTYSLLVRTAPNVTSHSDEGLKSTSEYCYRIRSFRTSGRKTTWAAFTIPTCTTTLGPPPAPVILNVMPGLYGRVTITWNTSSFTTEGFRLERAAGDAGPWVLAAAISVGYVRYHEDSGRQIEQHVCYRLIALNSFGESAPSNTDCTAPPAAPAKLAAASTAPQTIELVWEDKSSVEDGYEVQRADDGAVLVWSAIASLPANTAEYRDDALPLDKRFWYRVRATKDGGYSEFTPAVAAVTANAPPAAPTGTETHPSSSRGVAVYWWPAAASLADSFRVERSTNGGTTWITAGTVNAAVNAPVLVFDDVGLTHEERVCYQVFAVNRLGQSQPSNQDCTTPPAAPSNLRTRPVDDQVYEVLWDDNSNVEEGYILWLYEGYYDNYYPVELPANTTSYQISTSTYVDVLVAYSDGGYSDWVYAYSGEGTAALRVNAAARRRPSVSAPSSPKSFLRKGADR